MKVLINHVEPLTNASGQHATREWQKGTLYLFKVGYILNREQKWGEGSSTETTPKWGVNEEWEVTETPNQKAFGGHSLSKWSNPNAIGGSNYNSPPPASTNVTPPPAPPVSTGTAPPEFTPPATTAVPEVNPQFAQPTKTRNPDSYRQALIIAQSSFKVATEYVISLNDEQRDKLDKDLNEGGENMESAMVTKLAEKIAKETVAIAQEAYKKL